MIFSYLHFTTEIPSNIPVQIFQTIIERAEHERRTQVIKEEKQRERQQIYEAEIAQYRRLRREIEAMPQYEHWRQAVFEKFGRKCIICGCTESVEVDHRYKSLHALVRAYKITNTVQAYECAALWDVNNGAPLCKTHHDKTVTSTYHRQQNNLQDKA